MKRLCLRLLAAGVLLLFLMPIWTHRPSAVKFSVGPALPAGKVTPQLVHADDEAVLLAPDGSLWGWGGSKFEEMHLVRNTAVAKVPRRLGSGTDWRQVALISFQNVAFKPVSFQGILAIKADGSLWEGSVTNWFATPARIGTGTNWIRITCGTGHCLALQRDGSLWAWGRNNEGELGNGTTKSEPLPVRIGQDNDWKTIGAGDVLSTSFGLKSDGTVWGWGLDTIEWSPHQHRSNLSPTRIDSGTNWISISPAGCSLLALKSDGTLWLRGMSVQVTKPGYEFVQIGRENDWEQTRAGYLAFFARKRDGSLWAWGSNGFRELGTGSRLSPPAPQRLPFAFAPWAFSSGYRNTALLTRDGTLWTWGIRLWWFPVTIGEAA